MTIDQKKDLLRRYHSAWNTADLDNLRSMLNVNCVTHHMDGEDKKSYEFEPEACTTWHQSFANVKVNIQQLLVDDDRVVFTGC